MFIKYPQNQGFIRMIIFIIIIILVLSYFNIDIRSVVESEQAQSNIGYVWTFTKKTWDDYLSEPVLYFWQNIFINVLWKSFETNINNIKTGQPHTFDILAPSVPSIASTTEIIVE